MSPRLSRPHARATFHIAKQLNDQLPDTLAAIIEFEVCVDAAYPPTVRIPDVVITRSDGPERRLEGPEVLVALRLHCISNACWGSDSKYLITGPVFV